MYLRTSKHRGGIRLTLARSYRQDGKIKRQHLASIGNTAIPERLKGNSFYNPQRSMWFRLLAIRKWWNIPDHEWKQIVAKALPHLGYQDLERYINGPLDSYKVSDTGECLTGKPLTDEELQEEINDGVPVLDL